MKKLNIGCGKKVMQGYVNLDMHPSQGVNVVQDLEKFPYPFKEEEFDLIEAHQVLEHIHDLQGVMKELARILNKLIKVGNGHLYEGNFLRSLFPAWRVEVELVK